MGALLRRASPAEGHSLEAEYAGLRLDSATVISSSIPVAKFR